MTSAQVRDKLTEALALDLIGPDPGSALASETITQAPSKWYLTGWLVPVECDPPKPEVFKPGPTIFDTEDEQLDHSASERAGADDGGTTDAAASKKAIFPSSMGLSLLVPSDAKELIVTLTWGDYTPVYEDVKPGDPVLEEVRTPKEWKRTARSETLTLAVKTQPVKEYAVPNSGTGKGLHLAMMVKPVKDLPAFSEVLLKGVRSVSVFVVNRRELALERGMEDETFVFQAQLSVECAVPLVARPNLRGLKSDDRDERVADLQYRDAYEYAVGHGTSTHTDLEPDGHCRKATTRWIPMAIVERVAPSDIPEVELGMETLAAITDAADAKAKMIPLVTHYGEWLEKQKTAVPGLFDQRKEVAEVLLRDANHAKKRIHAGIELLADEKALYAFKLANKVMARAARQRFGVFNGKTAASVAPPKWRPFQLAFILMNLKGIAEPADDDREVVDLLFFPTGGGKTEAYLGLAAFTLVLRRLKNPGLQSAGLSVLMRYTLRLLTLDQLSRASTMICALELERQQSADVLGDWPFEIGLWVGRAATPNQMGKVNDGNENSARARTIRYCNGTTKARPVPLENCPWCNAELTTESFRLVTNEKEPLDLVMTCANRDCNFTRKNPLPIVAVDEPIYRRLPCFLIATVDKFAAMPWTGEVGGFFGRVERHDGGGFYGPCDPGVGAPLAGPLPPPDLIIQDELHLISGPMGTMVGLYESALDELCSRKVNGKRIRPKIVASTATVRRAEKQIRAIFDRSLVEIFPPPGPDRRDSFFARVHTPEESAPRLYVGVAAQGRSLKVILLRTYLALMASAQKWYTASGGGENPNNPADPYMTMLGYFNSLRELGGSRRIIEDEVNTRLDGYGRRKRVGEVESLFEGRKIKHEVVELTSRVSTDKVAEAKRILGLPFADKKRVDVAIATNMISVGLDIQRLGLMVVLGQPKTSAEYIQATSRVGRAVSGNPADKPGLVVTVQNIHRPRDRSHYERFKYYHETFYRSVEASSVTPFSPRALDRGLAGAMVALARFGHAGMTAPKGAGEILKLRGQLEWVAEALAKRASHQAEGKTEDEFRDEILKQVRHRLDEWEKIAKRYRDETTELQYNPGEGGGAKPLLHDFLDRELRNLPRNFSFFRANRSMRDVEPSVNLWLMTFDHAPVEELG